MSHQVCRSEQHSFSADIWGIMCFLYQMLVGKPPWMEFCYGSLLFKVIVIIHVNILYCY